MPGPAVGAVDVEPPVVGLGDRADSGQVVNDPGVGGPGGADHGGDIGEIGLGVQGRLHRVRRHPVVGGGDHQRIHLQQPQGVHDRGVGVIADHHPQPPTGSGVTEPPFGGVPGDGDGGQVAGGATGDEAATRGRRQAGLVGDQPQHGVLGGDRAGRLQPGDALDRGAGDQHVEQQAGLGRRCRDEAEEAWAVGGDDGRRDHRGVDAQHLVRRPAPVADDPVQHPIQVGGRLGAPVQRYRVHPQPVLGVGQDAADHLFRCLVDLMHVSSLPDCRAARARRSWTVRPMHARTGRTVPWPRKRQLPPAPTHEGRNERQWPSSGGVRRWWRFRRQRSASPARSWRTCSR